MLLTACAACTHALCQRFASLPHPQCLPHASKPQRLRGRGGASGGQCGYERAQHCRGLLLLAHRSGVGVRGLPPEAVRAPAPCSRAQEPACSKASARAGGTPEAGHRLAYGPEAARASDGCGCWRGLWGSSDAVRDTTSAHAERGTAGASVVCSPALSAAAIRHRRVATPLAKAAEHLQLSTRVQ